MKTRTLGARLGFVLGRAGLILGGLLAGLVAVEIVLRVFPVPNRFVLREQLTGLWQSDPELLLHLKPNLNLEVTGHPDFRFRVVTNAEGLRDDPLAEPQSIVAIGDSFTFGFGVDGQEAWPERLEAFSGVQVANLGWAGWNPYVYPAAIRRHALPLHADIWVWTFYANDLPESAGAEQFIHSGRTDFKEWAIESGLTGGSMSFPFNTRTAQLIAALLSPDLFLLPDAGSGVFDNGALRIRYSEHPWRLTDPSNPEVQRGWELTEAALHEANALATENDATLMVVFIPSREHVYWPFLEGVMHGVSVTQLDAVEARLEAICRSANIAYLSLLPGFRERGQEGEMLYLPNDGHWNARGHNLAAELIYAALRARGALPQAPR